MNRPIESVDRPEASTATRDAALHVDRAEVSRGGILGRSLLTPQASLLAAILIYSAFVATRNANFLTFADAINMARDASFLFIIAVAMTFVLVGGGIDLSVGSVFAFSSISCAMFIVSGVPVFVAVVLGVGVGLLCGLANGLVIVYGRIPPLIVTLGMYYIARGLDWIVTGGQGTQYLPDLFGEIASYKLLGVPLVIFYAAIVGVLGHVVLEKTRFGYGVRATGGNREAALASGINTARTTLIIFMFSGAAAGLSGVLMASNLQSGQPSIGVGYELQVITAAIIGGTSLYGGLGGIPGTLLGSIMISVLNTGLVQMQIDPLWQNLVIGAVLVGAVGLDQVRRARMWRGPASAGSHP